MNRNFSAGASPAASARKPSRLTTKLAAMMASNTIMASEPGTRNPRLPDPRTIGVELRVNDSFRLGLPEQVFESGVEPREELVPDNDVSGGGENLCAVDLHRLQRGDLTDEVREKRRADDDLGAQDGAARYRQPQRSSSPPQAHHRGEGGRIDGRRSVEDRRIGAQKPCRRRADDEQQEESA